MCVLISIIFFMLAFVFAVLFIRLLRVAAPFIIVIASMVGFAICVSIGCALNGVFL